VIGTDKSVRSSPRAIKRQSVASARSWSGSVARHLRRVSPCTYKRHHRVARIHVVINDEHAADTGYFAICTEILPRCTGTGTHLMFSARAHFLKSGGKL
jgi:hypothetical protein